MKKVYIYFITFLSIFSCIKSNLYSQNTFIKKYTDIGYGYFYGMQNFSNHFLLFGTLNNENTDYVDDSSFVIKVDSIGTVLWKKSFKFNGFGFEVYNAILSNNNYTLVGRKFYSQNDGEKEENDLFHVTLDQTTGDIISNSLKVLDIFNTQTSQWLNEWGILEIHKNQNNYYAICPSGYDSWMPLVLTFDDALSVTSVLKYIFTNSNVAINSFKVDNDNKFVFTFANSGSSSYLLKDSDLSDNVIDYAYQFNNVKLFDVIVDGNSYIISGYETSTGTDNAMVMKVNINGTVEWFKRYSMPGFKSKASHISKTSNNGYIIECEINNDILVINTDKDGNVIWSKIYGDNNVQKQIYHLGGAGIINTSDGFLIAGTTQENSKNNILLIKADLAGNTFCSGWEKDTTITVTDLAITPVDITNDMDIDFLTSSPVSVTLKSNTVNDTATTICETKPKCSDSPEIFNVLVDNDTCTTNSGTMTAFVSGGTRPYSYKWNDPKNQTDSVATGLGAGQYTVIVTDNEGCQDSANATMLSAPYSFILDSTTISCFGLNDGSISVSAYGGTSPYSYSWNTSPSQTDSTVTGLSAGNYIVTISDSKNCSSYKTITITEPEKLSLIVKSTLACYNSCNGTSFVSVSGGQLPYIYLWSNSETSSVIIGLCGGVYHISVTDKNECTIADSATITISDSILIKMINDSCAFSSGTMVASVSGGTSPYSYIWNDSKTQTDSIATGLGAGQYTVIVTDNEGCQDSANATMLSAPYSFILDSTTISCFGLNEGSITVSAYGGIFPYSYSWNTSPPQTGTTITGLSAGNYVVTILDSKNCRSYKAITITEPEKLTLIVKSTLTCNNSCNGTSFVSVSGGQLPYTYLWSSSETTDTINGLCSGVFYISVTDGNDCTNSDSTTILEFTPILINAGFDTIIGYGQSVQLYAEGGIAYIWTPSTYLNNPNISQPIASPLETIIYSVNVTDTNGCYANDSVTIEVFYEGNKVFIPNVFTPNENENNILYIRGKSIKKVNFFIYDRWGEKVFEYIGSDIDNNGWDGTYKNKDLNAAVLIYYGQIEYLDGKTEEISGNITLIR